MANGKKADGGKVNKMEAVRQVLATHGKDTMPVEIVQFARAEHGATLSADMASNYKSAILRKLGLGGKRKGKRGPKPGWKTAAAADGVKAAAGTGGSIRIDDIEAVKRLCDRMGAEKVQQLARVLAK